MSSQRIWHHDIKSRRLLHIYPVCELGILQYDQFNVCLGYPAKRLRKASLVAVLDVVGPKTDDLLFFIPPPLHQTLTRTIPYQQQYATFSFELTIIYPIWYPNQHCPSLLSCMPSSPFPVLPPLSLPVPLPSLPFSNRSMQLILGDSIAPCTHRTLRVWYGIISSIYNYSIFYRCTIYWNHFQYSRVESSHKQTWILIWLRIPVLNYEFGM